MRATLFIALKAGSRRPEARPKCLCSSRVKSFFSIRFFVSRSPLAKLPWRRKLFTVFLVIRQDKVRFETCPIQLFFIMIVDVGTMLFQLKGTVIASIEYLY